MKIYIAGPYAKGNTVMNIRHAVEAAEAIVALGHTPYIPHLSHFWDLLFPHRYEFWMKYDLEWLAMCDAVLRLPGKSCGADKEVARAKKLGKLVYYHIEEIGPPQKESEKYAKAGEAMVRGFNEAMDELVKGEFLDIGLDYCVSRDEPGVLINGREYIPRDRAFFEFIDAREKTFAEFKNAFYIRFPAYFICDGCKGVFLRAGGFHEAMVVGYNGTPNKKCLYCQACALRLMLIPS